MSVISALKWSFLSELAAKAIQPVIIVILARMLTPEDFGVVAAAMMVISFSQIFWDAGMGKAVIQYQGDREAAANVAFWINCSLGVLVALILLVSAGPIAAKIFHDSRVEDVLRVMSLHILLAAFASVYTALLQKDMKFRKLFWVRFATVSLPGVVSVPLAWFGMGYWSLIVGSTLGQAAQVLVLWKMSSWQPSLFFNKTIAITLIKFGGWVTVSGLLIWFYVWADSLIVGIYLGSHDLGLYRTGSQFSLIFFSLLLSPFMPVLYSHLSGIQSDTKRVDAVFVKVIRFTAFISIPLGFILFISSSYMADIVFGSEWDGVSQVISMLSLVYTLSWLIYPNIEYYRSQGRPDLETKVMLFTLPLYLPVYVYFASIGLLEFLWARLILALFGIAVHWWLLISNSNIKLLTIINPIFSYLPIPLFVTVLYVVGSGGVATAALYAFVILLFSAILGWNKEVAMVYGMLKRKLV